MSLTDLSTALGTLETGTIEMWPSDAAATVRAGLQSGDPTLVERAVRLSWPVMDEEIAMELLRLLESDAAPEVRAAAAIAFGPVLEDECLDDDWDPDGGRLGDHLGPRVLGRAPETLRRLFEDESQPKLVRRRALEASVRSPMDWQKDATGSIAGSDDEDWRVTALFCMGHLQGFEAQVLEAVRSASGDVRLQAVQAAGELELAAAGELVMALAASDDTEEDLRVEAIYAVAGIRPDGGDDLLHALVEHENDEIATAAEDALDEYFMDVRDLDDAFDEDAVDEDED